MDWKDWIGPGLKLLGILIVLYFLVVWPVLTLLGWMHKMFGAN